MALQRAGYEETAIRGLVGTELPLGIALAALRLRPEAEEPLTVLVRLFLAAESINSSVAARSVAPATIGELAQVGVLAVRGESVRARICLEPFQGVFVTSDHDSRSGADHVLGVGPASRTLAVMTVRQDVGSVLDLCCGSGVQALLAARHAERVIGADLNPRALRLARLNGLLNEVANLEWRYGDLFEPVGTEPFDLIVANPPFVVSPVREYLFRDGGLEADELSRQVVVGAGRRLNEGGYAHIMCSWVTDPSRHWAATPRRWLRGSGCDAWIVSMGTEPPVTYAMRWNTIPRGRPTAIAMAAEGWLAAYRARGISAITTGAMVLRRRTGGRNWVRADELLLGLSGQAGPQVERLFAGQDLLRSAPHPEDLLSVVLALPPAARIVERRRPGGMVERARITGGEGLRLQGELPAAAIPVVLELDGRRPLAEAASLAAAKTGSTAESLLKQSLPAIRELLARGLLVSPARTRGRH